MKSSCSICGGYWQYRTDHTIILLTKVGIYTILYLLMSINETVKYCQYRQLICFCWIHLVVIYKPFSNIYKNLTILQWFQSVINFLYRYNIQYFPLIVLKTSNKWLKLLWLCAIREKIYTLCIYREGNTYIFYIYFLRNLIYFFEDIWIHLLLAQHF